MTDSAARTIDCCLTLFTVCSDRQCSKSHRLLFDAFHRVCSDRQCSKRQRLLFDAFHRVCSDRQSSKRRRLLPHAFTESAVTDTVQQETRTQFHDGCTCQRSFGTAWVLDPETTCSTDAGSAGTFHAESTFSADSYSVSTAPVCNRMHQHQRAG